MAEEEEEEVLEGDELKQAVLEEFGLKADEPEDIVDIDAPMEFKRVVATRFVPLEFETIGDVEDIAEEMTEFTKECLTEHEGIVDSMYDSGHLNLLCESSVTMEEIREEIDIEEEPITSLRSVKDKVISFRNGTMDSLLTKIDDMKKFSSYCIEEGGTIDVSSWKERDLNTGEIKSHDFILNCFVEVLNPKE